MSNPYLGEIRMFGGNFAPMDWMFCSGQLLSISSYDSLFSLIGTIYGGDGLSTFGLPDLCGRFPVHQGFQNGSGYTLGQRAGAETVMLSGAQLPAHSHALLASNQSAAAISPANATWANWPGAQYAGQGTPNVPLNPTALSIAGGSSPHENLPPYLAVSFIICVEGIYPPRP